MDELEIYVRDLDAAISAGQITQAQADQAVSDKFPQLRSLDGLRVAAQYGLQDRRTESKALQHRADLESAISAGTITEAQADRAITNYWKGQYTSLDELPGAAPEPSLLARAGDFVSGMFDPQRTSEATIAAGAVPGEPRVMEQFIETIRDNPADLIGYALMAGGAGAQTAGAALRNTLPRRVPREAAGARMVRELGKAGSGPRRTNQIDAFVQGKLEAASAKFYRPIENNVITDDAVLSFLEKPYARKAAKDVFGGELPKQMTVKQAQEVREAMSARAVDENSFRARRYREQAREFSSLLDERVPGFKEANAGYAPIAGMREAHNTAMVQPLTAGSPGKWGLDEVEDMVRRFTPEQAEIWRETRIRMHLNDGASKPHTWATNPTEPNMRQLKLLIPDDAARRAYVAEARNINDPNSRLRTFAKYALAVAAGGGAVRSGVVNSLFDLVTPGR